MTIRRLVAAAISVSFLVTATSAAHAAACAFESQDEGHVTDVIDARSLRLSDGREIRLAGIELIAAFFVGIVAADIFISVLLRYFFSVQIPDSYDFGRLLLGILIFWGIAATSYRGTHITVDLVYTNVGTLARRCIDVFATLVLLFVVSVQTYTLFDKVLSTRADNVLTFDLRLPTWPFFLVAWLGDVSAVVLIAVRTYRLIFQPELMGGQYQIKPVE